MKDILTVSQLNDQIKIFLEEEFGSLWIEGELSNLRRPQSGHVYFTLKDNKSQIRAVFFRQYGAFRNRIQNFDLEDGMKILCRARLGAYPPRGEYQLIVESVEPQGTGSLQKAFEQLKFRLASEGLFDDSHKKKLPFLPRCIGIITSPTGAVIRDILNVTRRRFPSVDILIAPVRVQGTEAAGEIIAALRNLHTSDRVDVIMIARGGGSLEDLAPFNDEDLARAIFSSTIPVVSAVGHETDFTICDFVSDLRAPTPSAAAELTVPQRSNLLERIHDLQNRLYRTGQHALTRQKERLTSLQARFKNPRRYLMDYSISLDMLKERILRALEQNAQSGKNRLQQLTLRMNHANPANRLREKRILLGHLKNHLRNTWSQHRHQQREKLHALSALLSSLNPLSVLHRGYSITRRLANGEIVYQANRLTLKEKIGIQLAGGAIDAQVEKIHEE